MPLDSQENRSLVATIELERESIPSNLTLKDEIAAYWSARAPSFDASPGHGITSDDERDAWSKLIADQLGPLQSLHVLELASGTGEFTRLLTDAGASVTGLDVSEAMLARARMKLAERSASLFLGDAEDTREPDASYDAVVCRHLVWTLPDPQRALSDWFRVLRPGGRLSSWLRRIAAEYGVDLAHLAEHIGLSVFRPSLIDRGLSTDDVLRAATTLRSAPTNLRAMMHAPPAQMLGPSASLLQLCLTCRADHRATTRVPVAIRAWFKFWSIECDHCGTPFTPPGAPKLDRVNPAREEPLWFHDIRNEARSGARRLADFARRPFRTGWSPLTILRLLSMRFDAVAFHGGRHDSGGAVRRIAELFVPGLTDLWRANLIPEPWTNERPVRLVTARTILLAGMSTVLRDRATAFTSFRSLAPHVWHRDFDPFVTNLSRHLDQSQSHH